MPRFFRLLDDLDYRCIPAITVTGLSMLFAKSGHYCRPFFEALEAEEVQDPDRVLWSLCVLGKDKAHEGLARGLWERRTRSTMALQSKILSDLDLPCPEMEELRELSTPLTSSRAQDEVLGYLSLLSADVEEEFDALGSGGLMSVDARVGDVLVEFHGPQHYLTSLPPSSGPGMTARPEDLTLIPNGPTLAKAAALRREGWDLVQVPFWEWPKGMKEREEYLRVKVKRRRNFEEFLRDEVDRVRDLD